MPLASPRKLTPGPRVRMSAVRYRLVAARVSATRTYRHTDNDPLLNNTGEMRVSPRAKRSTSP